jgi:hypothetical protein
MLSSGTSAMRHHGTMTLVPQPFGQTSADAGVEEEPQAVATFLVDPLARDRAAALIA